MPGSTLSPPPMAGVSLARVSWYTAAILCLTNVVAFVDRTTLPLLVGQIEADLHISDTAMSLLVGLAFILAYSSAGLLAGALVDRFSRRALLAGGICVWAAATVASGFVGSFAGLFAARLVVGAGESITGPSAMSIVRDRYPASQRSRAIAIWAMGANLGGGIALLTGGAVLRMIGDGPSATLPLLGEVRSVAAGAHVRGPAGATGRAAGAHPARAAARGRPGRAAHRRVVGVRHRLAGVPCAVRRQRLHHHASPLASPFGCRRCWAGCGTCHGRRSA